MQLVRVADVPGADGAAVVVGHSLAGGRELGALGEEGVSVLVPCAPDWLVGCHGVDHEDGVLGTVDVGIDSEAEEVLVVVCIHACCGNVLALGAKVTRINATLTRIHLGPPPSSVFSFADGVGVQDAGQLDFRLDRPILLHHVSLALLLLSGVGILT